MNQIFVRNLKIKAKIGLYPWEQRIQQTLHVDLDLFRETLPATQTDQIQDTIDYSAICQRISELAVERHWQLIETLAEGVASMILKEFQPDRVRVQITKMIVSKTPYQAGINIERP